jgi:hypothetical protein
MGALEALALLATAAAVALAFALAMWLAVPLGSSAPTLGHRHRHVFRLPKGSVRSSASDATRWTWRNETVTGRFIVHVGVEGSAPAPAGARLAPALACCKTLDAKIYAPEGFQVEAGNDGTFAAADVSALFASVAAKWEAVVGDRFGAQASVADTSGLTFNGKNQVALGALEVDVPGALAVTGLWMTCPGGGSPDACSTPLQVVEWDQTYDVSGYDWALQGDSGASVYNLYPVALHEFGHVVGLDDLYADACSSATMYGYMSGGETGRDSIDSRTVACARELYGLSGASSAATFGWRGAILVAAALCAFP